MAVNVTFKVSSVSFNGTTYNTTTGGPIRVSYTHSGEPIQDRVGDMEYPLIAIPNKSATVEVSLRDVKLTTAIGTTGTLAFTILGKGAVSSTVSFATMALISVSGSQQRGEFGNVVLSFMHDSADGSTVPIS